MQKFYRLAVLASILLLFQFVQTANAQTESRGTPELSVVGVELGNRESAKEYLKTGHSPRPEPDGRASYYFYNEWGTQVMRLTVPSVDDPFFITEIEVFAVGESYQKTHYQDKENGLFITENGVFIGFRETAMYVLFAVKNAGKKNQIGPDSLVDIKGEPAERFESEQKREVLTYTIPGVKVKDAETPGTYTARYEFSKKKLRRFSFKIEFDDERIA